MQDKKKSDEKNRWQLACLGSSLILLWVPLVITVENHLPGKLLGTLGGHSNNSNDGTTSASKEEEEEEQI